MKATRGAMRFVTGKIGQMRDHNVTVVTPQAALAVPVRRCVFGALRVSCLVAAKQPNASRHTVCR